MLRKISTIIVLMLCAHLCVAQEHLHYADTLEMILKHNDSVYNAQCDIALAGAEKLYGVPKIDNTIQHNNNHIIFINGVMAGIVLLFIIFVLMLVLLAKKRVRIKWHY